MGDLGKKIARVEVLIGGVDQAKKKVKELEDIVKSLREEAKEAKKRMEDSVDTVTYDKYRTEYESLSADYKKSNRLLNETKRNIKTVNDYLQDISGQTLRNLNEGRRAMQQMLNSVKPENVKTLETVRGFIKQITDEVNRRKGSLVEFADVFDRIGTVSDRSLSLAKKRLLELIETSEHGNEEIKTFREQLQRVSEEENRRKAESAGQVMRNLTGSTSEEIAQAIKATEELRDAQMLGADQWTKYNEQVQNAKAFLEDLATSAEKTRMVDRFEALDKASSDSLIEQKKYWQGMVNGAEAGSQSLEIYKSRLEAVIAEEQRRVVASANKVMGNLQGSSVAEIKEAIKATEGLRDAQNRGDAQWKKYNQQILDANHYLDEFNKKAVSDDMLNRFKELSKSSSASLAEQKKYWQEMADGAEHSGTELDGFLNKLKEINKEEQRRVAASANKIMGNLQDSSVAEIKEAIKATEGLRDAQSRGDAQWEKYNQQIKAANEYLEWFGKRATNNDMLRRFNDLSNSSNKSLAEQKKYWQEMADGAQKNSVLMNNYLDKLRLIREEEQRRVAASANKVMGNLQGSSVAEIKEAIKATEGLRDAQSRGDAQWEKYNQQILDANHYLDEFNRRAVHNDMLKRFHLLKDASEASLTEQKKYWKELVEHTNKGTAALGIYKAKLEAVYEEERRRVAASANKVMGNLQGSSVTEINQAIKATEMLRDAQTRGSIEWEKYNEQIKEANNYLQEFATVDKWQEMEDRFISLGKASTASLVEQKKYWQEMADGAEHGSAELKDYLIHLEAIRKEEIKRKDEQLNNWNQRPLDNGEAGIKEAIKLAEELRDAQSRGGAEWDKYNQIVEDGNEYLKTYAQNQKVLTVDSHMQNIQTISRNALDDVKKFWQEEIDGAKNSDAMISYYYEKLKLVRAEENRRVQERAKPIIGKVKNDSFNATLGEAKEAVRLMEEYKQTLDATDADGLKEVNEVIASLNAKLEKAKGVTMDYKEALTAAGQVSDGSFKGTIEDVEKLKKTLIELRAATDFADKERLDNIDSALAGITKRTEQMKGKFVNVKDVIDNLKTEPLENLKRAAAQLQQELETSASRGEDFVRLSSRLRAVNERIREINRSWEHHDNQITATAKRLASYVMVYAGFNEIWGQIKNLTSANLELSDSLADIRKTTGLSAKEVASLSESIDELDTRSTQKQLHDLAYEAGKLGLKGTQDVLSFVKAGNQVIGSLGEDLGGAEAVRSLMKINDLLGETGRLGVEKALLATGSAINELSQNSTASAGPIAEIVSRLGAVGDQAKLSMADLIAFGGTADELSQDAEVVGTAVSKFITALQTNTHSIAQSIGVDDKGLEQLMKGGKMMDAILLVLRRVGNMGGLRAIDPIMKEFGSDGERLERVMLALANNVDVLEKRVRMSNDAFREATSVTHEYNIKNESSMALVERMSNSVKEFFVNSANEGAIHKFLQGLSAVPAMMERNYKAVEVFKSIVIGLTMALVANRLALLKTTLTLKNMKLALGDLKGLLAKNWISITVGTITTLGTAFYRLSTHVSAAAKAVSEHSTKIAEEKMEVEALFMGLKKMNESTDERVKLIDQINSKYGQYLGFLLDEKDSSEKLAAAQDLINAKIRERMALQLKEKMTSSTTEKYGDLFRDSLQDIAKGFEKSRGIRQARSQFALNIVQSVVSDNIKKPVKEILEAVKKGLAEEYDNDYGNFGTRAFDKVKGDVKDFIKAQKDFHAELKVTDNFVKNEQAMAEKERLESTKKVLAQLLIEHNKFEQQMNEADTDVAKDAARAQVLAKAKEYVKLAKTVKPNLAENELKGMNAELLRMEETIAKLTPKASKFINVWGEGMELDKATVNQLVAKYKELFKERKSLHENADYQTVYSAQFADRKEAMKWYMDQLTIIKKRLNEMGYNEHGNFLKNGKGGNKGEHEAKEAVNAAMAALEAWYNREQQLITRSYIEREITEEEYHRRSLDKEEEFLLDRIALRERLLGKKGGEFFKPEKYVHKDEDTGEITEYFKGKDLTKLQAFLKKFGDGMLDGMFKKLTEDELTIFQRAVERTQRIQKILLDNDFTQQVDMQYKNELEKLELFWGVMEQRTEKSSETRLAQMKAFATQSYDLTVESLKKKIEANEDFSEWRKATSDQDYQALLLMLRKYHDDVEEAENREIARKQRISDKKWKKDGIENSFSAADEEGEDFVNFTHNLKDIGILDQGSVDDAEIALYKARMEAAQAYYDYIRENGGDLNAAEEKRQQAITALNEAEMEAVKHKLETLKQYTDAVVDFSEQMGEAAFGEVSDRKAAAKQLLKTTMKLTKDLLMEQVKRLVMQQVMKQKEIALEQSTETAKSMIHGASVVSELTAEGAKTVATTEMGIAQGSAKTIGKLGWWGIPLIAVISAALSALMGLALGKMNKAKKEVQAATGASSPKGRVAAGMLTYAKGDYPILGNDGKVYNASYQKELKTGVYRGGAHFGLFSEKEPEMIVDGKTTRKLIVDYPHLYESILTIAQHGRIKEAAMSTMPVYANGSYPAPMQMPTGNNAAQNEQMMATLVMLADTVQHLKERLDQPINAVVDPYGKKGAVNQMKRAEKFMRQTGQIP